MQNKFPKISVVMPTLNSERTLVQSLTSISIQSYPGEVEIIVADGGSRDSTLHIAKSFKARIIKNLLKTGEAGKAAGAKIAKGQIIAFIDSDNILPDENWLVEMTKPFQNPEVLATEPFFFTYRRFDKLLTRYFALIGMGDPLNLFIGNYDRYSHITNKWTGMKLKISEKKDSVNVYLKNEMPTIGANGFLIRKDILNKFDYSDYLFDIDVLKYLSLRKEILIVKVKVGIVHLFSGDLSTFVRKQKRRIRDFLYYKKTGMRKDQVDRKSLYWGVAKFIIFSVTVVPLVVQTLIGYFKKPDLAWFFHPVACYLTLIIYVLEYIRALFKTSEFERSNWSQ